MVYKTFGLILYRVWSAALVGAHAIGLGILDEAFLLRIEGNLASQLPADGGREAATPHVLTYFVCLPAS